MGITENSIASLANTAVTPGTYSSANITVDEKGRITAAASGSTGNWTVPSAFTSAAIQTAIDSGETVYCPAGTYTITTALTLQNGQRIFGDGKNTIFSTSSNISIILTGDNCTVENIAFLGSLDYSTKVTTGITAQIGIELANKYGALIQNCFFNNLGGYGIYGNTLNVVGSQYIGNIISNCVMKNNNYGFLMADGTYYYEFNHVHSDYNLVGAKLGGGNNKIIGGSYSGNWTHGIWITGSDGNDAHSTINGADINHNNQAAEAAGTNFGLYLDDLDLGYTISGCPIFSNDISVTGSKGVVFSGCIMDVSIMKAGGSQCLFSNCEFLTTRPTVQDNTSSLGYSDVKFSNFRSMNDTLPIQTTGTTATTVYNYVMQNVTHVELDVTVIATGGNYVGAVLRRRYILNKNTGTLVLLQTDTIGTDYIEATLAGITLTTSISSATFNIQVNGLAATTIRWKATQNSEAYHK